MTEIPDGLLGESVALLGLGDFGDHVAAFLYGNARWPVAMADSVADAFEKDSRAFIATMWRPCPAACEEAAPGACGYPFLSVTWLAAMQAVTSRCGADPASVAAGGLAEFTALVRPQVAGWGGKRPDGRVLRAVFAALTDAAGAVGWSRRGLLRRVADELGDLQRTRAQLRVVEADMTAVLGELGLSRLSEIPGLTAAGAAVILAETGDPRRYQASGALVKHAGLSPADHDSGAVDAQARISRRGRPGCGPRCGARSGR